MIEHETKRQIVMKAVDSKEFSWQKYRRLPMSCWAIRMNQDFDVRTLEGLLHGHSGDWLVKGDDGNEIPVPDVVFRRQYTERE